MIVETVIFSYIDIEYQTPTRIASVNAVADVDRDEVPYAVEVLWFKERLGEADIQKLMEDLDRKKLSYSYDDEVDALSLWLDNGRGYGRGGSRSAQLALEFIGDALVRLVVKDDSGRSEAY